MTMSSDDVSPPTRTAAFGILVREVMRPPGEAPTVAPGTRCDEVVTTLASRGAGCVVVVDAGLRPVGIVTATDVAARITYRVAPETPVEAVMTRPVATVRRREHLYQAIAWMRRRDLRHLPVVDRAGRLVGLLHLHEALEAASARLMRQIDRLGHEDTVEGMREVKAAQVELAEELFAEALPATDIQRLLSHVNNDMYRRVGEGVLRQMAAGGWGEPPVVAVAIVMGSGGREENFLFPDQDNGIVLSDYPDADHGRVDSFYIELAERLCRTLNEVGIPYCNGYCMAVNPLWRKTLSQWVEQVGLWTRRGSTVAIRLADIFFDFQPVWGEAALARDLRREVTRLVRASPSFLRQMYRDEADHGVALGFFGGFVTERETKEYRGRVNLKYTGTVPLVGALRLMALREGVEETSTLDRIRALADLGVLEAGEPADLARAFSVITDVLLRAQIADFKAGRRVTYFVDPDALGKRTRADLLDALRIVHALRKRVHMEFTAQLF